MPETSNLALVGYGKMGRLVEELAPAAGFSVTLKLDEFNNQNGYGMTAEAFEGVDVAIDFSIPEVVADNAVRLCGLGVNTVIGTTGWLDQLDRVQSAVDSSGIGLVHGANFSVGVNAFYDIIEVGARAMAAAEDYDAWAWEAHHKRKLDAPSGTMLRLIDAMKDAGYERPVDVSSTRVGYVPGTHEIGFDSEADSIQLRHTARSRVGFARGALRAARWILAKKGLHEFSKIWRETL